AVSHAFSVVIEEKRAADPASRVAVLINRHRDQTVLYLPLSASERHWHIAFSSCDEPAVEMNGREVILPGLCVALLTST
ncbi:MAG: hypothetical protein KJO95_07680, partial [Gammaproteobacteria bacterium]|nr:hypothetical protein [Gammaproteobacteria bacterium]